MAYVRGPIYSIDCSASLLPSNLSLLTNGSTSREGSRGGTSVGVIHKNFVTIGRLGCDHNVQKHVGYDKLDTNGPVFYLTQVRWCKLENSATLLVLTTYKGFRILDVNEDKELYKSEFETPPGTYKCRFAKGIASVGNTLCIGTSEGTILVLSVCVSEDGTKVELTRQLQDHESPISDLATNRKGELASVDEEGTINVWTNPLKSTEPSITIKDSSGVPCLCLSFWNGLVIGGFANGQLRLYNSESGMKLVEIAAHARSITALDVASSAAMLLSVSEDCTLSLWSLPMTNNPKVNLVQYEAVEDTILCGGRFLDPGGNRFAVTGYDSCDIITYIRKSTPV